LHGFKPKIIMITTNNSLIKVKQTVTRFSRSLGLLLVIACLTLAALAQTASATGTPDSCTPPATTYGTDTMSVYVPATATYTVWTRMEASSASANSILLNIDNTNCYNVGGDSSIPTNGTTWDWVDDYGGSTASLVNVSLTQGTHSFTLTGTESGVSIDRLIAMPVTSTGGVSCTPSNTQASSDGNNCAPLNNTAPPTVSTAAGTSIASTAILSATAAAHSSSGTTPATIASVQFHLNGNNVGSAITTPSSGTTYSYTWDSSSVSNGTYSLSAVATDSNGIVSTSSPVSVTVAHSSSGGPTTPTLTKTLTTATSVSLSWPVSTDSSGTLTGYHLYRGGTLIASPTGTSYIDSCLAPSTNFSYTITAYDSSHTSPASSALSITTESQIGDLDGDNLVAGHDLSLLIGHYGTNWGPGEFDCTDSTLTTNVVEGHDLSILTGNYGK